MRRMKVRERVKELMDEAGLSQAEVARRVGENPNWVGRRLNPKPGNKSSIEADDIPRLAEAIGKPCSAFFPECQETLTHAGTFGGWQRTPQSSISSEDLTFQDIVASDLLGPAERDALAEVADVLLRFRRRLADDQASGE